MRSSIAQTAIRHQVVPVHNVKILKQSYAVSACKLLIDTSVWIGIFHERTGKSSAELSDLIGEQGYALSRFTQLELLQGSRDEQEWSLLQDYLVGQDYIC